MTLPRILEEWLVGRVLFPLSSSVLNRRGILPNYRQLLRTQYASADELHHLQLIRLHAVLSHAAIHVPYYRRLFAQIGFDHRGFRELADLREIPPLTRQHLVHHRLDLVDERWRAAAERADAAARNPGEPRPFSRLIRNTSSGSTGAPTVFYEDGAITAANWANELRLRSWFNVGPGAREARMARVSADYVRGSNLVKWRARLWNQLLLPGISLTEADYAVCVRELLQFRPRVLWGFTSALAGLAHYVKRHGIRWPLSCPEVAIAWAAPLYDHERAILEEVMRCPVTNIYGMREVGHIAALCLHGSFHVNQESIFLETAPLSPGPVAQEEPGELLATTLTPTPMPFIRYRTGDIGLTAPSACRCGRTLSVIKEFTGRTGEIHITRDGRMIAPNFWCRTFMDPSLGAAVDRFQVVYRSDDRISIRIIRGASYTAATEEHLRSAISRNLCDSARIEFDYVSHIAPLISGKYQMVVKETGDAREPVKESQP